MKITIEIAKRCKYWNNHKQLNKRIMAKICQNIIARFANLKQVKIFELSILLTDNAEISELNNKFRGKNQETNVLSFPDIPLGGKHILEFQPDLNYMYLGDMAFSYQQLLHEAEEQHKLFEHHFLHLFVHSMLHLLGFDHQKDEDAVIMESLEIQILQDFAINSPYL